MSNIFNFRPAQKGSPDSDFLKDADDTVEFVHNGRDVCLGDAPQHFLQAPFSDLLIHDWSNQELANIYRVKKLLDAAGVPNDLERGISDEGDPWCIFCTLGGDVFIHLGRIDGRYVLDSPNLRAPIFGVDFAELIEEFSAGALQRTPSAKNGSRRVIRLERNGKVFLHPAALLAALIWSIYLESEELVMFAPQGDYQDGHMGDDSIALINETALSPLSEGDAASAAQFMTTTALPDQMINARLAESTGPRGDDIRDGVSLKDMSGKLAMFAAPTPVAVGLSSIAIAFGIMSESFFDPATEEGVAQTDVAVGIEAPEVAATENEQDTTTRSPQFDLIAVLQSVFDQPPAPDAAPSALSVEIAGQIDLSMILSSMLAPPAQTDIAIDLAGVLQDSRVSDLPQEALIAADERESKQAKTAEMAKDIEAKNAERTPEARDVVIASTETNETTFDLASLLDFKATLSSTFQTFDFGGVTVEATFDIATLSPSATDLLTPLTEQQPVVVKSTPAAKVHDDVTEPDTIDLASVDPPVAAPSHNLMDVNAHAFVNYLYSRLDGDGVEMIKKSDGIILLDLGAYDNSETTYHMGWTLEDGNTVFAIGLKSDFVEYDLIA